MAELRSLREAHESRMNELTNRVDSLTSSIESATEPAAEDLTTLPEAVMPPAPAPAAPAPEPHGPSALAARPRLLRRMLR